MSGGRHEFVNFFVFALDKTGAPTSEVLFMQTGIPNTDDQWTTFYLPEPIHATNGFMLAISYDYGYVGIGTAVSDNEYPFAINQYYSIDYSSGEFYAIGDDNFTVNFMIRANGTDLSSTATEVTASTPTFTDYKLYRLTKGSSPAVWTALTQTDNTSYIDNQFKAQPKGSYQYAVVATYRSGTEDANAVFSNVLNRGNVSNEALAKQNDINVYPNPAVETVYVQMAHKAKVEVFDVYGKKYISQTVIAETILNISNCPTGALFVKITTDNSTTVHKIMKIN
jgi:hypothetical protein